MPCQPVLWCAPRVGAKPSLCSNQSEGTRSRTSLELDGQLVACTLHQSESLVSRLPCSFREPHSYFCAVQVPARGGVGTRPCVPRAAVRPRPLQHLQAPARATRAHVRVHHGHPFSFAQASNSTDPTKSLTSRSTPARGRPEATTATLSSGPALARRVSSVGSAAAAPAPLQRAALSPRNSSSGDGGVTQGGVGGPPLRRSSWSAVPSAEQQRGRGDRRGAGARRGRGAGWGMSTGAGDPGADNN